MQAAHASEHAGGIVAPTISNQDAGISKSPQRLSGRSEPVPNMALIGRAASSKAFEAET